MGNRLRHATACHARMAEGRIERLWGTLTGSADPRDTVEAAHAFMLAFIADFNRRLRRPTRDARAVWRQLPRELAEILSCRYSRVVGHDDVVQLGLRAVSLPGPGRRSYAR